MATTANAPLGTTPVNGGMDPFTGSSQVGASMRFAPFDNDQFSMYHTSSPSQTKRALEAHLKDTDRRIQDASRLGTTLVQQRKDLAARLQDVEEVQQGNEVPQDLRKKLAELEKEYNEVGKESARSFLPKSRVTSTTGDPTATPSAFTGAGRESPTKMTAPSRRQRNQPSNRVHDIEFATEISTSLLAQVRQLQTALAEKDDELREATSSKAQLEADAAGMVHRIKQMDESEHRFKDENWNLEMRLQELEASIKESSDKEQRLHQNLKATEGEKAAAQRDLDDLKVLYEKLSEEQAAGKRQQELDIHGLRRDATSHETEKSRLQKKIDELTAQNTELAKAVSYRMNQPGTATDTDFVSAEEEQNTDDGTPDNSEPASPVKGTPRHGMLESETLKSSLNHAHRMIQNLKNNIHREKTEKIELKRMLQDARDELEVRRSDGNGAAVAKKRRSEQDNSKFRKPARPLGATRGSTTEILEDEPDWEDHDGANTPSKSRGVSAALGGAVAGAAGALGLSQAFGGDDTESTDAAFETATEREGTTTDAFETATEREGVAGDDSDDLTETEDGPNRAGTIRKSTSPLEGVPAGSRRSFESTASVSDDDETGIRTPIQAQQQPKYRLRGLNNRGSARRGRVGDIMADSPGQSYSPSSSQGTPQPAGQSLGDELDALDDDGTPSRYTDSAAATPEPTRQTSHEPELGSPVVQSIEPVSKPEYADAGVMTEPWEPEPVKSQGLKEKAGEVMGGALAGFGLARIGRGKDDDDEEQPDAGTEDSAASGERPQTAVELQQSSIVSQDTEPTTATPVEEKLEFSPLLSQDVEPEEPSADDVNPSLLSGHSDGKFGALYTSQGTSPARDRDLGISGIPGTAGSRVGAGFFAASESRRFVDSSDDSRQPLGELSPNATQDSPKQPVSDEGSQTMVSGDDIDNAMKSVAAGAAAISAATAIAEKASTRPSTAIGPNGRRSIDGTISSPPKRPASAGSARNKVVGVAPPPLPEGHTQKIAEAQKTPAPSTAKVGTMGPPLMPASAYKQNRPRTSASNNTTPRGRANTGRDLHSPSIGSRRTSVSSFASELDERFNIGRGQLMYPEGVIPATDPRMIQAITQTMIGEYLWKYTRKAGRSETSSSRHRRFFWVHPYTRTLYWSEKDPSAAGKDMLKAKSVAIEAVRVITDDNAYPPGLHRKSLIVVTPGREIVFTAPTSQRHETWFNALSYLLLRTEHEKEEAEEAINQEDIEEFNPSTGIGSTFRRSISRMTGGRNHSRASLSSYNSRTTRTSSPTRPKSRNVTLAERQSAAARSRSTPSPDLATASSRQTVVHDATTSNGRFSSLAGRLRPSSAQRGSYSTTRGRQSFSRGRTAGSDIYNASVAAESAEDLRAVIERQEQDADRLENVRACCDGKHDVGSLSRNSRLASFGNRLSAAHNHTHSHPPQQQQQSTRSRRGE